ncbi:MAG: hypothetical protein ACI4LM_02685, partial [Anaerovoracaceae bacterium]
MRNNSENTTGSEEKHMHVPVTVLARNEIRGLTAVRLLGEAGFTVDLVAIVAEEGDSEGVASSMYIREAREIVAPRLNSGDFDMFREAFTAIGREYSEKGEKPLLFPAGNDCAAAADEGREEFSRYFVMTGPADDEAPGMKQLFDISFLEDAARAAGLNVRDSWIFPLKNDPRRWELVHYDVTFPCVISPANIIRVFRREDYTCETGDDVYRALNAMRDRSPARNAHARADFEHDFDIQIPAVCDDGNIVTAGCAAVSAKAGGAADDALPGEDGAGCGGKTDVFGKKTELPKFGGLLMSQDLPDGTMEKVRSMLASLRYRGMVSVKLSVKDGVIYFDSMDFGCSPSLAALGRSGADLPAVLAEAALGMTYDHTPDASSGFGKTYLDEKKLWDAVMKGRISLRGARREEKKAGLVLLSPRDRDSAPVRDIARVYLRRSRSRRFRSFLRRWFYRLIVFPGRKLTPYIFRYPQIWKKNRDAWDKAEYKVMVVGRNYGTNLCLARSIGKAGYEVEVLRLFQQRLRFRNFLRGLKPDAYSRYVRRYHSVISHRRDSVLADKLIELADPDQKKLLVTSDDVVADTVDLYYNKLKDYYYLSSINEKQGGIDMMMDKSRQKALAKAAGLRVADSRTIRIDRGYFEVPDDIRYPCFVKPNMSRRGTKTKMRRCDSRDELCEALSDFPKVRVIDVLVEEFIDIDHEYSLLGVSTGKTTIGAIVSGQTDRAFVEVSAVSAGVKEVRAAIDQARSDLTRSGRE